jgi:hypothetical protein
MIKRHDVMSQAQRDLDLAIVHICGDDEPEVTLYSLRYGVAAP